MFSGLVHPHNLHVVIFDFRNNRQGLSLEVLKSFMYGAARVITFFHHSFINVLSGKFCQNILLKNCELVCFNNVEINISMFRWPVLLNCDDAPKDVYSSYHFVDSKFKVRGGVGNPIIRSLVIFLSSVALGVKIIYCRSLFMALYSLGIICSKDFDSFLYDLPSLNTVTTIFHFSKHFSSVLSAIGYFSSSDLNQNSICSSCIIKHIRSITFRQLTTSPRVFVLLRFLTHRFHRMDNQFTFGYVSSSVDQYLVSSFTGITSIEYHCTIALSHQAIHWVTACSV